MLVSVKDVLSIAGNQQYFQYLFIARNFVRYIRTSDVKFSSLENIT